MARARPTCTDDGCDLPKCLHSNRWCHEGWLRRQSIAVREKYRLARLALVPEDLRRKVCPERLWPQGRRWCSGCQSFPLLADCSGSRCRTCASVGDHGSRLIAEYGVTREFFDALLELQSGVCYVCGANIRSRRPALDHDHATGRPRGLVCADPEWGCNVKILAKMDASGDPLAMAYRLVAYFTDPPATKVLVKR